MQVRGCVRSRRRQRTPRNPGAAPHTTPPQSNPIVYTNPRVTSLPVALEKRSYRVRDTTRLESGVG